MNVYEIRTGKPTLLGLNLSKLIPEFTVLDLGLYSELQELLTCGDAFTAFVVIGWVLRWADTLQFDKSLAQEIQKRTCSDDKKDLADFVEYEIESYIDAIHTVERLRKKEMFNSSMEWSLCIRRDDFESLTYAFPDLTSTISFTDVEVMDCLKEVERPRSGMFLRLDLTRKHFPDKWWSHA